MRKRARIISWIFVKKRRTKNLPRVVQGLHHRALVNDRDNEASPSFWPDRDRVGWDLLFLQRDHDCGALRDFFLWQDCNRGTVAMIGCDNKTSSSPTRMRFTLGTSSSSSLTCAMPNSYFIVSNVICKNRNIPK
jgi:hypothetical protein